MKALFLGGVAASRHLGRRHIKGGVETAVLEDKPRPAAGRRRGR